MTHPMLGPQPFKLGLFSINADGGLTLTKVPERWPASWPEIVALARMADAAGLDFLLPIARWKGFEGETNARQHSFETLTFCAALGAVTERIGVFATVHVPMVHPLFAAKALATADHAASGRAGLNVVAGWNPDEFAMFGLEKVEKQYEQAAEWIGIIERLYAEDAPFDHDGTYYRLKGAATAPKAIQRPRPVILNAAFSPPGRDFAAAHADMLLTTMTTLDSGRDTIADIGARAAATGRQVGVCTTSHVVCRPTKAEAEAYYEHYAVTEADAGALDHLTANRRRNAGSHEDAAYTTYRMRFAAGGGTYPLVGAPQDIADEIVAMHAAGLAGTTLSFVNFLDELPYFVETVLPLLREAGVRS